MAGALIAARESIIPPWKLGFTPVAVPEKKRHIELRCACQYWRNYPIPALDRTRIVCANIGEQESFEEI